MKTNPENKHKVEALHAHFFINRLASTLTRKVPPKTESIPVDFGVSDILSDIGAVSLIYQSDATIS